MHVPPEPDPYVSPRIQFGTELRKFRLLAGFTQQKLCTSLHISISHLSMIENGHRSPTWSWHAGPTTSSARERRSQTCSTA
ncbi:helix-turn-helix domain-containing protein [Streptosporangium sp. G11]|uniref:helix-turn-helix domain-containing protein n=1 Tax=Streptosporangium sp. G11 TaxID=3436926 RepID=UPI003EBA1CB0